MCDTVFRNALIVDGTGRKPFTGSLAVTGGRITHVGPGDAAPRGRREIDAAGRVLAPGWVDIHGHMDAQVTWDPYLSPSSAAGVTTLVNGNCGVGFAPCREAQRGQLVKLMEAVEDIPAESLMAGTTWEWETFPEYLDALGRRRYACDFAVMIAHSAVRVYCVDEAKSRAADKPGGRAAAPITSDETRRMAEVVREGIAAGAIGFSMNRFQGHRDSDGGCTPGTLAQAEEVVELARAVAEGGGGVVELATDFSSYDDVPFESMDEALRQEHYDTEWRWMRHVASNFGIPVCFGLGASNEEADAYRHRESIFPQLEAAAAEGGVIKGQVFARPQGLLMSFISKLNFLTVSGTYQKMKDSMSTDALRAKLLLPDTRVMILGEIRSEIANEGRMGDMARFIMANMDLYFRWQPGYEPHPDDSVMAIAKRSGKDQLEVAYDFLAADGGHGVIWRPLFTYATRDLEQCRSLLEHPCCVPGISDAGAHLAIMSDATAPTFMLSHWARDRTRGPRMPIEAAVKKQSHDTARLYGLHDRGSLELGKRADLNLIDLDRLAIHKPEFVHDLPAGAPRWMQSVTGYALTMVHGEVTYEDGRPTGALPGRLVRNPGTYRGRARDIAARFDDTRKRRAAAPPAAPAAATSADAAVDRTISDGSSGTTHMSRIARAMDDEVSKKSKL